MSTTILTDEQFDTIWLQAIPDGTTGTEWRFQICRAIEQAVLQSPEVQRLREGWASVPIYPTDEMVRAMFGQPDETGFYHFHGDFGNIAYQFGRLIDAAMEMQT